MKRFGIALLAFCFWLSLAALGQDTSQQQSSSDQSSTQSAGQAGTQQPSSDQQGTMSHEKGSMSHGKKAGLHRLKGKISDDGKSFTSDKDGKSWTIENPDAVKGHEGHDVRVRAHVDTANNSIHVMSLKMAGEHASKSKSSMSAQPPQKY
jgi:hypothetical protein